MKMKEESKNGFFGVYKPAGPTSHDIIDELRKITGISKIGHAGTLDPAAKGILVVAVGRQYTKKISKYRNSEKEYKAIIELGKVSDTDDKEGRIKAVDVQKIPKIEEVESKLEEFTGTIEQIPPVYSAVKINGTPSYKLAREGKDPEPPARKVIVKDIELINYDYPKIELKITTGPGVYIRAIARDLGEKLETGGLLADLVRTKVGEFNLKNSYKLDELKEKNPT